MLARRSLPLLLAACLLLAGCGESELYTGLTEQEANQMVAVINQAGMQASKTSKDGKTWTLLAPRSAFGATEALLAARGYPRERFDSLGDIFKKDGFVSSPLEEHARLIYGLSQELSNTLSGMDGVVYARVQIALPEQDPLSDTQKPSSAAVFIKYDPQVDLQSQVGAIKSLVVNSIEGLTYDRVSVVLSPAQSFDPPMARAKTTAQFAVGLRVLSGALGAALAVTALWLWLIDARRRRAAP